RGRAGDSGEVTSLLRLRHLRNVVVDRLRIVLVRALRHSEQARPRTAERSRRPRTGLVLAHGFAQLAEANVLICSELEHKFVRLLVNVTVKEDTLPHDYFVATELLLRLVVGDLPVNFEKITVAGLAELDVVDEACVVSFRKRSVPG